MGDEEDGSDAQAPVDTDTLAKFFGNLMNRKPGAGANGAKP